MREASTRGYPIGALFVLVTLSATLIAGLAPALRSFGDDGPEAVTILIAVVGGIVVGGLAGAIIGLYQYRWVVGGSIGIIAGTSVGAVAGLLMLAPARQLPAVAATFVVGSALMVGVALVMRQARR